MSDIRYAVRSLVSAPLVTGTALAVLALGIGVTTAIFTLAYGVLRRPLPFADPDRLVQVGTIGSSSSRPTANRAGPSTRWWRTPR